MENLKTNDLFAIQLDKINLTCDKVLSAALRQLLDEILFPLRLSSFRRKILINTKTVELSTQDQELRRHSSSTQDLLILSSRNNKDGTSVIIVFATAFPNGRNPH